MTNSFINFTSEAHYEADVALLGQELIRCMNRNKAIMVNLAATVLEICKGKTGGFSPIFDLLTEYAKAKDVPVNAIISLFEDAIRSTKSHQNALEGYGIYKERDIKDCCEAFAATYTPPQINNVKSARWSAPLFATSYTYKEDVLNRLTKNSIIYQKAIKQLNQVSRMYQDHLVEKKSVYTKALIVGLGDTGVELWRTVYKDYHDTALTHFKETKELDVLAIGRDSGSWGKSGVSYLSAQNAYLLHRVGEINADDFTLQQAEMVRVDAKNIKKANDTISAMRGMPRMQADVISLEVRENGALPWAGEGLVDSAQNATYKIVLSFVDDKGDEVRSTVYTDHIDLCTGLGQKGKNIAETMIKDPEQQARALKENKKGFTPCINGTEVVLENKDVGKSPNRMIIIYGYGGTAMAAMRKCVWGAKDKQPDVDNKTTQAIVGENVYFMCRSGTKGEGTLSSGVEKHMQWMEDNGRIIMAMVTNLEMTQEDKVLLSIDKYELIPNGVSLVQGADFKEKHDELNKNIERANLSERERSFLTADEIKSLNLEVLTDKNKHYALKDINRRLQIVIATESTMECDQLITALGDDPTEFENKIMKVLNKDALEYIKVPDLVENKEQVVGVQAGPNIRIWGAAAGVALKSAPVQKKMTSSTFSNQTRPTNAIIPCTMPPTRAGIGLYAALKQEARNANINASHMEEIRRVLVNAVIEKDKTVSPEREKMINEFCTFVRHGRGQSNLGLSIDTINKALKDNRLDDCVQLNHNSTSILIPERELLNQVQPPEPVQAQEPKNSTGYGF
ncbi:MAG: hypothetical protein WC627_11730 [Legionella sp.]|jgi:hypothetical protein